MTSPTEDGPRSELELTPERMLELADQVSRIVVNRIQCLPDEAAWLGGSRAELEPLMREDPPEEGRPPEEVIERAAREILPDRGQSRPSEVLRLRAFLADVAGCAR